MNKTFKYGKTFNSIVLTYFILIIALSLIGKIRFGQGLGDIFVLIPLTFLTLVQFILTLVFNRQKRNDRFYLSVAILFFLVAIYVTWRFTFGRGIEYIWDGYIFNSY